VRSTQKLVLLMRAQLANQQCGCRPSLRHLQQRTGLSERCLRNNPRQLEAAGLIRCQMGRGHPARRFSFQVATRQQMPQGRAVPGRRAADPPQGYQMPGEGQEV